MIPPIRHTEMSRTLRPSTLLFPLLMIRTIHSTFALFWNLSVSGHLTYHITYTTCGNRKRANETRFRRTRTRTRCETIVELFRMDFQSQFHTQKNAKCNRMRIPPTVSLPSIFFFLFLVSHFVTTTTIVVIATDVVNSAENGAATIEDIDESETLSGETLYSPQDIYDNDETNTNNTNEDLGSVGTIEELKATEETFEDASNTISDASTTSDENNHETGVGDDESTAESVIEDAASYANEPLEDNITEETEDNTLLSSATETMDTTLEEDEEETDTTTSSSASEDSTPVDSDLEQIEETSSARKTRKGSPEVIEKKRDMEGGIASPLENKRDESSNRSSGASTKSTEDKDVPKKTMMGDDSLQNPPHEQDDTEKAEDAEDEASTNDNTTSSDAQSNTENETETQDEYPVHDNGSTNDDSVIDLDSQTEGLETDSAKGQNIIEEDDESVIIDEDDEGDEDDGDDEDDTRGVSIKARARARAREDRRNANSTNATNTSASEVPTAATTDVYRGEPWGQYRSTRRLPDLELLRLLFEDSNKTKVNSAVGDVKSQKVVNDWQNDSLYDEKVATEAGSGEPFLDDEQDPQFLEYRARLLGKNNDGSAGVDQNIDENAKEETQDTEPDGVNANDGVNNADVNSEFVEGLDDIDKFFEGVNPPDELDVGYGSSIQDVLMDKSKQILLKKVRGVARWIKIGWRTLGSKLEERISEFQMPFQKIGDDTTSTASGVDTESANASKSVDTDQIVKNTKEALVTAWRVGKQAFEVISDFVDGLLDRFDDQGDNDAGKFDDFEGFDLDNLSTFQPPV